MSSDSASELNLPATARAALREVALSARLALSPAEHARLSAHIAAHLRHFLSARSAACIAFYQAMRGEFDAQPVVESLLAQGWSAALPVVVERDAPLVFRAWQPTDVLLPDVLGIAAPAPSAAVVRPQVVLIPLLAFDAAGYRLGYGGGYFDRTLAAFPVTTEIISDTAPLTLGLGFECTRQSTIYPQRHDIRLDVIITEAGVQR